VGIIRNITLTILFAAVSCRPQGTTHRENDRAGSPDAIRSGTPAGIELASGEALLLTRYKSFEALKEVIQIVYGGNPMDTNDAGQGRQWVRLTHRSGTRTVTSELRSGISQIDFTKASKGSIWDKALVAMRCPYAVWHRDDLRVIENLGRRRPTIFGKGDIAFYDLAETMVHHISDLDVMRMQPEDLSEKGYLNTFNHIIGQSFMTAIFSERMADFVADVHERYNMPELMSGRFTEAQLADLEKGPVDNYLDIINNEWGQELGKELGKKYSISRNTKWSPELLARFLNDIQSYHSWVFSIGFTPFRASDDVVIRFSAKMNRLILSEPGFNS
jgi:hypothetical protein